MTVVDSGMIIHHSSHGRDTRNADNEEVVLVHGVELLLHGSVRRASVIPATANHMSQNRLAPALSYAKTFDVGGEYRSWLTVTGPRHKEVQ